MKKRTTTYLILLSILLAYACIADALADALAESDGNFTAAAQGTTAPFDQTTANATVQLPAVNASQAATHPADVDETDQGNTTGVDDGPPSAHVNKSQAVQDANTGAADDETAQYKPAIGCLPPTTPEPEPQGAPIQQLPHDQKPNFIIILTDDQGWDDIGLHHPHKAGSKPQYVNTPNIDRFLLNAKKFDNFYVAPMCSHSRAALLTGRDYPLTGTMLVNGGYDYINHGERTSADIFSAGGYKTAHFGKWHNGRTLGYEPWFVGFQESWFPDLYINLDNLMRHNGEYVQTYGLMEQDLMDKMLGYLDQQAANNSQPFYLYYAPNAIHQGFLRPGQGPKWQRPAPEPYLAKYTHLLDQNISISTVEVWAMLEYMDDVLGRLFDYVNNSTLKNNTYIMIMSDNGSELFMGEMPNREVRMPSGMQGYKRAVEEGGIRNFLGVQGPGVQAGVIDSTLLDITDVLPTMVDLAGLTPPPSDDLGFTGISFKNLLLAGPQRPTTARLAQSLAAPEQKERFLFSLSPICWDPDSVPDLDEHREVIKPQKLLDYDVGGYNNAVYSYYYNDTGNSTELGFERCIGVRYQDYKWIGRTGKVYKFNNSSHIELPCNEVTGAEGEAVAALMSGAARQWWKSLVASPHAFQKPTFYLGFEGWSVTNILPDGAHDRTPGNVKLLPNGAAGFVQPGDRMCFALEIIAGGRYEVVIFYTSRAQATFSLSVGKFSDIQAGAAPSLTKQLPAAAIMAGQQMGYLDLQPTEGQKVDACLVLEETQSGKPVFTNLGNIRFTRQTEGVATNDTAADLVYDSRSSNNVSTTYQMHAGDGDITADGMQKVGGHNSRSRRNRRQHSRRHGVTSASAARGGAPQKTGNSAKPGVNGPLNHHNHEELDPTWSSKASRQIVPEWLLHEIHYTQHHEPHLGGFTWKGRASDIKSAAGQPRQGERKAEPITARVGVNSVGRRDPASMKGRNDDSAEKDPIAIHLTEHPRTEVVHVAGKRGVSRKRLYNKGTAPVAASASGVNVAGEYPWLMTNSDSRMRLGGPTAEPEEVIGAVPDRSASKKRSGSDASRVTKHARGQSSQAIGAGRRQQDSSITAAGIRRTYLKPTEGMRETEREALKRAARLSNRQQQTASVPSRDAISDAWQRLRLKNNWPDGQTRLESMFSPYHVEMIDACKECQPQL